MNDLPEPSPIREFGRIDGGQFQEIRALGQPAVFRGLASDWPAVRAARQSDQDIVTAVRENLLFGAKVIKISSLI